MFQTQGRDDLFAEQIRNAAPRGPAHHHADDMGVDRDILPLAARLGETVGQVGGKVIQLATQSHDTAHAVNV